MSESIFIIIWIVGTFTCIYSLAKYNKNNINFDFGEIFFSSLFFWYLFIPLYLINLYKKPCKNCNCRKKMNKIYLKLDKKPKTVRELLKILYCFNLNENQFVDYWAIGPKSMPTFSDKECTKIQCGRNKNRSFKDVYIICKTYFHNVSEKKVFLEMLTLKLDEKETIKKNLTSIYHCCTLQDMRFMPTYNNFTLSINDQFLSLYKNNVRSRTNSIFNVNLIKNKEINDFLVEKGIKYYTKHYAKS